MLRFSGRVPLFIGNGPVRAVEVVELESDAEDDALVLDRDGFLVKTGGDRVDEAELSSGWITATGGDCLTGGCSPFALAVTVMVLCCTSVTVTYEILHEATGSLVTGAT